MLAILTPKEPLMEWARTILGEDESLDEYDDRVAPMGQALGVHVEAWETDAMAQREHAVWFADILERVCLDHRRWPDLNYETFCEWVDVSFDFFGGDVDLDVVRRQSPGELKRETLLDWRNAENTRRVGITRDEDGVIRVIRGHWSISQWDDATMHFVDSLDRAMDLARILVKKTEGEDGQGRRV
ncbi:MAG: hypothetical protein KAI66_26200 [Lentisphaeria bacterium]|nr:hypothetical protein [Lentisphaeria bacterium]